MFQRIQVGFHRSVVDTQELICGGHHVDTVGFAFRAFLVHELVNWLIHWSALQEDAHTRKSVLRREADPLLEMLRLRTSIWPDWYGGASMPAKATSAFLE